MKITCTICNKEMFESNDPVQTDSIRVCSDECKERFKRIKILCDEINASCT